MTLRYITKVFLIFAALASFAAPSVAQHSGINWMSLEEAVQAQQDEPRKIMMDVYTQWCGPCKMMMRNTFTNADVIAYINANYYAVKFDAESQSPVTYQDKTFENPGWNPNARGRNSTHQLSRALGVNAYPTLVYFDENANVIAPISGYKTPQQLELYLKFFTEHYKEGVQQQEWEKFRDTFQPSFQ
jgi:thioredoxin-related protein